LKESDMTYKDLIIPLSVMVAALPLHPAAPQPGAPPGTPQTRYCLRVDPETGSRIETIQCRTREDWADLDVDVDQEWAANGVRVIA
jgi:hypothetical protein